MDKLLLIGTLLIALLIAGKVVHFKLTYDQYKYTCYWATKHLPHCVDRTYFIDSNGYNYINHGP